MNSIKNLSLAGICMAFIVIALGAWTRLVMLDLDVLIGLVVMDL